jgi:hypothetical protein
MLSNDLMDAVEQEMDQTEPDIKKLGKKLVQLCYDTMRERINRNPTDGVFLKAEVLKIHTVWNFCSDSLKKKHGYEIMKYDGFKQLFIKDFSLDCRKQLFESDLTWFTKEELC